ncbi:hypothetical protein M0R45_019237 [Rubus argutus]|uniref:Uncharacterized protein n=1 Tax=Rubus argutus TaxID=59490 RepID=A0AAW1X672_RUBAR
MNVFWGTDFEAMDKCFDSREDDGSGGQWFVEHRSWKRYQFLESIVLSIMELGLECTLESPEERVVIKEVVNKLNKIKLALLHDMCLML